MSLVFGAIAPHGGDLISQIADDLDTMAVTRAAMQVLGHRFAEAQIETVIVLTPHGFILDSAISIGGTKRAAGILGDPNGRHVKTSFECDTELGALLVDTCEGQIPLVRLVGEKEKEDAVLPLDWGALVPLWFTAHRQTAPRPKVLICAPDRRLPRAVLVRFGVILAQLARASDRRVALIASCDQGHAHDPDGPYGFDAAAAEHDDAMCAAIAANDLASLLEWPDSLLECAKVDAYWQTLILAGALSVVPLRGELLSYEAPTYFGMAVASYTPVASEA